MGSREMSGCRNAEFSGSLLWLMFIEALVALAKTRAMLKTGRDAPHRRQHSPGVWSGDVL
jgi:hypothetical protein